MNTKISVEQLLIELRKIASIDDQIWQESLSDRKIKEIEFHDKDRDRKKEVYAGINEDEVQDTDTYEKFYGNRKYYQATADSNNYVDDWINNEARDKIFLDYACGNGKNAIKAAKAGAQLAIGLDISPISIENCKEDAKKEGVEKNTFFFQADCENTKIPTGSIDRIICSGMLHHLDLTYAFPELRRILASEGKILGVEALDYNPAIKLYRNLTPQMRTEWEKSHILSLKDLKFGSNFFNVKTIKYWHMLSILSPHIKFLGPLLNQIDRVITKIPLLRLWSWIFTFELHAKD